MRSLLQARPSKSKPTGEVQAQNLPNRPLVEAIFELRWELLGTPDEKIVRDPGFEFLLGRFFEKVRGEYPERWNLPAAQAPIEQIPFVVRHQFRTGSGTWPLLQIGPGILTVNETSGYEWSSFRARVARALTALFDAYPEGPPPLRPSQAKLRYINSIPLETVQTPLVRFLREQLHTSLSIDPALFEDPDQAENPTGLSFSMTFPRPEQRILGTVAMSTGRQMGQPSLLWQLEARTVGDWTPVEREEIESWTGSAHEVLVRWFVTLARGDLMKAFSTDQ
jgi:uncharacterized protein (TIGR04255 family)